MDQGAGGEGGSSEGKVGEPSKPSKFLGKERSLREDAQSRLKKVKSLVRPLMGEGIEKCIPIKGD